MPPGPLGIDLAADHALQRAFDTDQRRPGVVRQLLARGARPDVADFAGNTPRSIGLALGDEPVLALLRQAEHR